MLEVRNLTCGYDSRFIHSPRFAGLSINHNRPRPLGRLSRRLILKDINLKVNDGELIGVIGPNGSGKTTFLRAITRILKPIQGTVLLDEKDIWQMGFKELAKKIAVVPQGFNAGIMSLEEFVLLGRIPYFQGLQFLETKKDLEIAKRSMTLTDTFRLKDRLMNEISGGEKQLALIARALTQEPKLLLLDEPTTHLDITHQVGILDLIKRLNREFRLTVIMVLHDLNLASEYCHRLILLNEGRVHRLGNPDEVLTYQIIEDVYKTIVVVKKNPISSKPYILVVSEEEERGWKRELPKS